MFIKEGYNIIFFLYFSLVKIIVLEENLNEKVSIGRKVIWMK